MMCPLLCEIVKSLNQSNLLPQIPFGYNSLQVSPKALLTLCSAVAILTVADTSV